MSICVVSVIKICWDDDDDDGLCLPSRDGNDDLPSERPVPTSVAL